MKVLIGAIVLVMAGLQACGGASDSVSESKNVFGEDNRVPITTGEYPWRTIGLVTGAGWACTGTLVARDLVLTAAHCVMDPATKALRTDIQSFKPNYKNGSSQDESGISYVWWGTNDPQSFRSEDWAILRLSRPLGDSYGWLSIRHTTLDSFPPQLSVAGYSSDFHSGQTAGVHHDCMTRGRRNFILHDCDTSRGSSGGPALRMYDNKLTIVGVNVAEYRNGGETSLKLSNYHDDYANIVIPTNMLIMKVKEIIGQ